MSEPSEAHSMEYQDFYVPYADDTTSVSDQTYDALQLNVNGSLEYISVETDSFARGAPFASTSALLQVQETRMSVSVTSVTEDEMAIDPSTQSPGYNFSFKTTPRDKKFLLVSIGLVNLFAATSFSLLGPFFPQKAIDKGASQTVVGLIFGIFEFVSFISSPVFGNYTSSIGPRFLFTSGIMVSGVCTVLFGVLGMSPGGYQFVLMCFLTRAMDALGTSAMATSSYAVLAFTFPRYLATVVGYLEMFTGVGMMLGPAIGGALYSVGGYGMPFYVIGSVQFLSGVVGVFVMPSSNDIQQPSSKSAVYLLRSPVAIISGACVVNATYSYTFLEATLAQHIKQFSLSPVHVSLVFLVAPALYAIVTPFWGWLSDAKNLVFSLVIMGCISSSVVFILIGPCPWLLPYLPRSLWLVLVSLVIMGIFYGPAIIPLFTALFIGARSLGMPDNVDTYGIVSGYFNACFSLGAFLGPICGSALMDASSFGYSATICAGLFLFSALLVALYIITERHSKTKEQNATTSSE